MPEGIDTHHLRPTPPLAGINTVMHVSLALHLIQLAASIKLNKIARRTPNFSMTLPLFTKNHPKTTDNDYFDQASEAFCTELRSNQSYTLDQACADNHRRLL